MQRSWGYGEDLSLLPLRELTDYQGDKTFNVVISYVIKYLHNYNLLHFNSSALVLGEDLYRSTINSHFGQIFIASDP